MPASSRPLSLLYKGVGGLSGCIAGITKGVALGSAEGS